MSLRLPCLFAFLVLSLALPAAAGESAQKSLGTFGKWHAYTFDEHNQTVCYMALTSAAPAAEKLKRGPRRLIITHRPAEGSKDVISYAPGYMFKADSVLTVKIGAKSFELFTTKDTAWARDPATDRAIATAIRSAKGMTMTGLSTQHGAKPISDALAIDGAAQAYQAIGKACGYADDREQTTGNGKKKIKTPTHKH